MARERGRTFLARLARDKAGNVIAMAAAGLIPLIAMVGGAIDASRVYMAYTRLQQACDSGALAGRKAMNLVTTLTAAEQAKANEFFDFNFPANTYSATDVTRAFSKGADGVVNGTASANMPTTIMKMFGYTTVPLSVTCQSTLNIPNTDVMFVLDVTGSMDATPSGDTVKKIDGLKAAVKDFYSALGPGAAAGPGRVRYGFMPYSSNVNVGRLLYAANPAYLVGGQTGETWTYQSRRADTDTEHYIASYGNEGAQNYQAASDSYEWGAWGNVSGSGNVNGYPKKFDAITQNDCNGKAKPGQSDSIGGYGSPTSTGSEQVAYPDNEQTLSYTSSASGTSTQYQYVWTRTGNRNSTVGTCQMQSRTANTTRTRPSTTTRAVNWADRERFVQWIYEPREYDVSPFVQNTGAQANPVNWNGASPYSNTNGSAPSTITWGGCIEEAETDPAIVASSSLTPPSGAYDLDIDLEPTSSTAKERRWKPFLREVQYNRDPAWLGRSSWIANGFAACPREASRLTMYTSDYVALTKTSAAFNGYVDSLAPIGGTYHDIGLIWGARFLSPDGIFAADNRDSAAPGGYQVSRHIVFMTDGQLDTRSYGNDPWGINDLDGRIAPKGSDDARMNESHERRTQIICNSMKGKGYVVWVIGFGISDLSQTLKDCASDDAHWSVASNSATLRAKFASIARTIGGLRLSQ